MRSTIVLSLLTVVSITVATEASANSNGMIGLNGDLPVAVTNTAPLADDHDPDGYVEPGPCWWWKNMVNMSVGTFDWRRTAARVCLDYYEFKEAGKELPDGLVAAFDFLAVYEQAWKDRQVARDAAYNAWKDHPGLETSPEKLALRQAQRDLDFTETAKLEMAEETGLLMVLQSIENGY